MSDKHVRTRFAPSPTGTIHIGSVYQILINWAYAKNNNGDFILRIEDTDKTRQVEGAIDKIYQGMDWLGLTPDEGPKNSGPYKPYIQSKRLDLYQKYAQQLVNQGDAYYCFCSSERLKEVRQRQKQQGKPPMYDRKCRKLDTEQAKSRVEAGEDYVIRMKIPDNQTIMVNDLARGEVKFDSNLVDDQIILKSDGYPTYHLAVVVDDHLMKISHTVRGEEWLPSAPKHVLLYQYFNWEMPEILHTPTLRNPDKSKMSKRHGHTSLFWYKDQGFLPQALLNYIALLGWSHPKEKEIFSLKEFVKYFDFKDVSPIGPVFDLEKLEWMNGVYIRKKSNQELAKLLQPYLPDLDEGQIKQAVPLIKDRLKRLSDVKQLLNYLTKRIDYKKDLLLNRGTKPETAKQMLEESKQLFKQADLTKVDKLKQKLRKLIDQNNWNTGEYFMVLRVSICGSKTTPPIVESLPILGEKEVINRLEIGINKLS
jgi:glutamyl-tRNA synthetase